MSLVMNSFDPPSSSKDDSRFLLSAPLPTLMSTPYWSTGASGGIQVMLRSFSFTTTTLSITGGGGGGGGGGGEVGVGISRMDVNRIMKK